MDAEKPYTNEEKMDALYNLQKRAANIGPETLKLEDQKIVESLKRNNISLDEYTKYCINKELFS